MNPFFVNFFFIALSYGQTLITGETHNLQNPTLRKDSEESQNEARNLTPESSTGKIGPAANNAKSNAIATAWNSVLPSSSTAWKWTGAWWSSPDQSQNKSRPPYSQEPTPRIYSEKFQVEALSIPSEVSTDQTASEGNAISTSSGSMYSTTWLLPSGTFWAKTVNWYQWISSTTFDIPTQNTLSDQRSSVDFTPRSFYTPGEIIFGVGNWIPLISSQPYSEGPSELQRPTRQPRKKSDVPGPIQESGNVQAASDVSKLWSPSFLLPESDKTLSYPLPSWALFTSKSTPNFKKKTTSLDSSINTRSTMFEGAIFDANSFTTTVPLLSNITNFSEQKPGNKSTAFKKEFGEIEDKILIGSNMILVIAAVVFNVIVIKFYKHQTKRLIPFVYLSVAVADLVTALSCLLHPVVLIILLISTSHDTLSSVLILVYFLISSTSIRVGVFYNLVLSVVRSINIVRPFYQIELGYLKVAHIVYPAMWTVVGAIDVYWIVDLGYIPYPKAMFKHLIYKPMSGSGLAAIALNDDSTYLEIIMFGMTIPFLIPCLFVSVCLVLQIHYLNISTAHLKQGSKIVSRRPAITIFQLTLLFITCNLTATAVFIYFYAPSGSEQRRTGARDARIMYVSSCVLHVFNATFSPLIMILRGRSLKSAIQSELKSFKSRFSTRSSSVGPRSSTSGVKVTMYRY